MVLIIVKRTLLKHWGTFFFKLNAAEILLKNKPDTFKINVKTVEVEW